MWTPKRIVLLAAGFAVLALVYLAYSMTSLGRINTLPPLPEKYSANNQLDGADPVIPWNTGPSQLDRKIEQAFRPGCPELRWPFLFELNSRNMVIAAGDFKAEKDGRVLLKPMSLAMFGKKKNDGKDVEINTLRCERAYLTFDQPVYSLSPNEIGGRKVVAAELFGDGKTPIVIENNRRTAAHDDDLTVTINTGPLHYLEKKQIIWTNDSVHLRDGWLEPPRADIRALGMEMELTTAAPPPKPGMAIGGKTKNDSISGVKRIVLKQDVTMHLHLSGGSPLPGGSKPVPAETEATADAKRQEPAHLIIRTPGRFQYDLFKDHDMARFDVPDDELVRSPQDVTVQRVTKEKDKEIRYYDQLVCKHLELRVKRHGSDAAASGAAAQSAEQGMEIETAHATGPFVTLTSDLEKLDAHGTDFFHDTTKKLTILKGKPFMEANKEDSLIQAPELRIQDIPLEVPAGSPPKMYQRIQASGPGRIHLTNKTTHKQSSHAYWDEQLISTRDRGLDLLVLTGAARFEDEDHRQSLKADTLKVWLLTEDEKTAAKKKPVVVEKKEPNAQTPPSPQQARRPHLIEALRNVVFHSPQVNIPAASRLVLHFTDVPPERMPPPSTRQPDPKAQAQAKPSVPTAPAIAPAPAAKPATVAAPHPAPAAPETPAERPIELMAYSIETYVLRCEERMAMDNLWAEGSSQDTRGGVQVRQAPDPTKKGDRGVFIKGNTLNMKATPEGNILDVTGDLAQLEMNKIIIIGPTVNIDQARNQASVTGKGAMQIQTDQSLEGKALDRSVPLVIHWSQDMFFSGKAAEFHGDIEAVQENYDPKERKQEHARLACQLLQVLFDKPISLKEGVRGDQPAKIRKLVGDRDVRVEDKLTIRDRLEKYQYLEGRSITMETVPRDDDPRRAPRTDKTANKDKDAERNNDANDVTLSGPGSVRMMQRGGADMTAAPGQSAPLRSSSSYPPSGAAGAPGNNAGDQVMKMTYIRFDKLMKASNRTNAASFWGSVQVLNFPSEDPHCAIDLEDMIDKLPEGWMYQRCDQLKAFTDKEWDPKTKLTRSYQRMDADGRIIVRAKDLFVQADHMKFNEKKDQIIFMGEKDHPVSLEKRTVQGEQGKKHRAKKILYFRKTGQAIALDGDWIEG